MKRKLNWRTLKFIPTGGDESQAIVCQEISAGRWKNVPISRNNSGAAARIPGCQGFGEGLTPGDLAGNFATFSGLLSGLPRLKPTRVRHCFAQGQFLRCPE